jgi:ABC-type polysaccharide/polyol phosphate transport system ATPase subunit/glycosyltransferase involved in cell wall biosynthesis
MPDEIAIKIENVSKIYKLYDAPSQRLKEALNPFRKSYHQDFHALSDLSFEIKKGETVGILGRNGTGKSTLLKIITGIISPTTGNVTVNGKVSALLELGAGFNPQISGLENVYFNGTLMGFSKEEMDAKLPAILAFADIGEFIHQDVMTYSSGMFVRLAFAVAVHADPEILIVDEALAVGDMMFQAKCMDKIKDMMQKGITTVFVTHDMNTVNTLCTHAIMLEGGRIFTQGKPQVVTLQYYQVMREKEHTAQVLKEPVPEVVKEAVTARLQKIQEEIQGKSSDEDYRYGSGAAKIIDFEILDAQKQKNSLLKCGETFYLRLTVKFFETVKAPCVGFSLSNIAGQNLLAAHSFHDGPHDLGQQDSGDILEVEMGTAMLLNPGKYLLSFGVAEHRSTEDFTNFDARKNVCTVEVYGKETSYGMIYHTPRFKVVPSTGGQQSKPTGAGDDAGLSSLLESIEGEQARSFGECTCGYQLDIRDFLFKDICSNCQKPTIKKIDIGAGSRISPDYVHLDSRGIDHIEIVCPAGTLPIPDGMLDEVYSRHTIEHFAGNDIRNVLSEWTRVLKNGGKLVLNYPDFDKYIEWFGEKQDLPIEEKSRLIYGDQNYSENVHRCAINDAGVEAMLRDLGLTDIASIDAPVFLSYETPMIGSETSASKPARKMSVLLVCDSREWALGTVAKYFARYNSGSHDMTVAAADDEQFNSILAGAAAQYDLIHWLSPWLYLEYGSLVMLPQVVSINHVVDASQFIDRCRAADAIHTLAQEWEDKIRGLGFDDVFRIPIGVDAMIFAPAARPDAAPQQDTRRQKVLLPLFGKESSNQEDRKGTDFLLQIAKELSKTYLVEFMITGYGWDSFIEQLTSLNIAYQRKTYLKTDEMRDMYAHFDFFLITSKVEGGPFPLLEAMASGIPAICTPVGIAEEVITDGIDGFIIPFGDVRSAVDKIKLLMDTPGLHSQMGARARETVMREWTWEKVSSGRLAPLYAKALENHRVKWFLRNQSRQTEL